MTSIVISEDSNKEEEQKEEMKKCVKQIASVIQSLPKESVIAITGAGISTSAGIPDFRSNTGVFATIPQKYNLPNPQSLFDIDYFVENPKPFFELSKDFILSHNQYKPTKAHYFLTLLQQKGLLKRVYTQNIDGLDLKAGILDEKLVMCHGSYESGTCLSCTNKFTKDWMINQIKSITTLEDCVLRCDNCKTGIVKPDIVFYGEELPDKYFKCHKSDFHGEAKRNCKFLLVIGTSLQVAPVSTLVENVYVYTHRLLVNREKCGTFKKISDCSLEIISTKNEVEESYFDFFMGEPYINSIDEAIEMLCEELNWEEELKEIVNSL
ncbi:hypothetical protein ABK040_015437 [Willaertia magna]